MKKILTVLIVAAALALFAYPVGVMVDRAFGRDAVRLEPAFDATTVEVNRGLFELDAEDLTGDERRDAVVAIYGSNPKGAVTERYLFVADDRLIVPKEDDQLALLPRTEEDYPVQSLSLLFLMRQISMASMVGLVVLLLVRRFTCGSG